MATTTADSTWSLPVVGLPAESPTRSIPIPAPIKIDNSACSTSRSPFGTSPDLSLPPPNPQFVFPGRQGPSSAPSSYSRATGRRTKSAFEPADRLPEIFQQGTDRSPRPSPGLPQFSFNPGASLAPDNTERQSRSPGRSPALPDFSFNPGARIDDDNNSLLSPPKTPQSPHIPPGRHGHRRGASEFVGGKLRAGDAITIMSTSPTKTESGFASPLLKPTDPPARKRGHQHRRSAAISQHDLTMILKPSNNSSRGSSAPTSPAALKPMSPLLSPPAIDPPMLDDPSTEPSTPLESMAAEPEDLPPAAEPEPDTPPKAGPRARVGFSDTLEFIPRPLSLVSTDTTSTYATIRPGGHSATNSISSIISLGGAVVVDRESGNLLGSVTSAPKSFSRPSTAGAVLENIPSVPASPVEALSPRRRNSIPLLIGLGQDDSGEPSVSTPTKTPKRWSFFGLEPFTGSSTSSKARPHSSGSNGSGDKSPAAVVEPENTPTISAAESDSGMKKSSSKKKKKQKKVRAWGTSILTRKGKSRPSKIIAGRRRSLTPPPPRIMFDDSSFDDESEGPDLSPFAPTPSVSFPTSNKIVRPRSSSDDEASYQMIDLDAALGPFNTPSYNAEWEAAQRTGQSSRRPLHSAAGMRGFTGPGMHYHRRAESAPNLPPFEGKFGMNRFGSSSTMADVFEEEEEEDDDDDDEEDSSDANSSIRSITTGSDGKGKATASTVSDNGSADTPTQERDITFLMPESAASFYPVKRKGSGSSLDMQPPGSRMRTEITGGSLHDFVIIEEECQPVPRPASATSSLAAPSPRRSNRDLAPVDVHPISLPPPSLMSASPYSINHSSSFPSPRSPMSDVHRISTAPSSVADENSFQSLLMGEPGPEIVRISVDVPSLTSSNSTMTRDSAFLPPIQPRGKPFSDQRPASFTSSAFGRRRSSLASLSRLISSAHGDRSKLSVEHAVEDEPEHEHEHKAKVSRAKRISRMMQFWKSKQQSES